MIDASLKLMDGVALSATADGTKAADFHQVHPTSGTTGMFVGFFFSELPAGSGTVQFVIKDSADNSTFSPVITGAAIKATDLNGPVYLPLPAEHKRYLKAGVIVTSTVTGGKVDAFVTDGCTAPATTPVQGIAIIPDAA